MYVAFWIRPEEHNPNKRLVVCRPYQESPNTAWAVLRASIREKRTGGIIAGPKEDIDKCVEMFEKEDQNWPDDPDRMVAAITTMVRESKTDCQVIFKQNVDPKFTKTWAVLDGCGLAAELTGNEEEGWSVNAIGSAAAVETAAEALGENASIKIGTRLHVRLQEPQEIAAKATLKTSLGESYELKLPLERTEEILDLALGPDSLGYQFCLLVRNRTHSIVFFGSKITQTINQAIDHYVTHLAGDEDPEVVEDIKRPAVGQCRFWKLRHR